MDARLANLNFENVLITPVARLVQGGLKYMPDMVYGTNDQKFHNFGLKKGSPRFCYFLAVAIPKNGSVIWKDTEWGQKIMRSVISQVGKERARKVEFSKILDGDAVDNVEKPGFSGNWILKFKTSKENLSTYNRHGKLLDEKYIESFGPKKGDYVRVTANIYVGEVQQTKSLLLYLAPTSAVFVNPGERIHDEKGIPEKDALALMLEGLPPEEQGDSYPQILDIALNRSKTNNGNDEAIDEMSNFSLTKEGEKHAKSIQDLLLRGYTIDDLVKNGLIIEEIPF